MSAPLDLPYRLTTERLVLRCWEPADAPELFAAIDASRQHLKPWMPWVDATRTEADSLAFVRRARGQFDLGQEYIFGLFSPTGQVLGGTGLHRMDPGLGRVEIGYWLRREATGQGLVTESTRTLTELCLGPLGLARVEIRADVDNHASRRVPERLGFTLEGVLRASARRAGPELRDTALYAMIQGECPTPAADQV